MATNSFRFDKSAVNWPFYANAAGKPHKHFIIDCSAGLCNRLYSICGSMRVAAILNRKLIVWWPINGEDGLGCAFEDLFATKIKMFDEIDLHWLMDTTHSVKVYHPSDYNKIAKSDREDIVLAKLFTYPYIIDETTTAKIHEVKQVVSELLRNLTPVTEVTSRVKALGIPRNTFGVHIRREAPFMGSTTPKFIAAIRQRLERSHLPFFLATDYEPDEKAVKHAFGELVITHPKTFIARDPTARSTARATRDGMLDSMVDLYGLAQCSSIIGTADSSFSRVAEMLIENPTAPCLEL